MTSIIDKTEVGHKLHFSFNEAHALRVSILFRAIFGFHTTQLLSQLAIFRKNVSLF